MGGGGASWTMFLLAQRRLTGPGARRAEALKGPYVAVVFLFCLGAKYSTSNWSNRPIFGGRKILACMPWMKSQSAPPRSGTPMGWGEIGTMYTLGTNHLFGCVKWKKKRMVRLHFVIFRGTRWGYDIVKKCRGWLTFPPEDGKITLVSSTKNT